MNERIRELAKEAAKEMNETGTYSEPKFQQKFAELIIRECANAIITDSRLNDVRSAANGCVRTIKEHFEVDN